MGYVIGVVGASGGLGASSLTAAIAVRALTVLEHAATSVAVDGDPRGGLDVTLCVEHEEGQRWAAAAEAYEHSGRLVAVQDLPGDGGVRVLAGPAGDLRSDEFLLETVDDLSQRVAAVVIDCGPRPGAALLARLDVLLVVSGTSARAVADLAGLVAAMGLGLTRAVLVTRSKSRSRVGRSIAGEVGLEFLCHLPDDPAVPRHAQDGLAPGRARSVLDGVADEVLAMMDASWLRGVMASAGVRTA